MYFFCFIPNTDFLAENIRGIISLLIPFSSLIPEGVVL